MERRTTPRLDRLSGARALGVVVDAAGDLVVAGTNVPAGLSPSGFVARYIGFGAPASGTSPCGGTATTPPPPTTVPEAPTVTTGSPSGITASAASISGSVNPNGQETSYHFEYGTSSAYGSKTAAVSAGSGTAACSSFRAAHGAAAGNHVSLSAGGV